MKRTLINVAAIIAGFVLLAAMRWSAPGYDRIIGPIPSSGAPGARIATDNLAVVAGMPRLARTVRFGAGSSDPPIVRGTGGMWLVVPVTSSVTRKTGSVEGLMWQARDGRRYAASARIGEADAVLTGKFIQPGMERKDLLVFEIPPDAATGGTLLLSEDAFPQLVGEVRVAYPNTPLAPPVPLIDLDQLDAKL